MREGGKEGRREGRQEGKSELLSIICRKLAKNKSVETIAEELEEEDVEYIRRICDVAVKYAPEYDIEKIYEELYPATETA